MTLKEMILASGGRWTGDNELLEKTPLNIVTDSRQAVAGSLFIAIRGERTDGHRYIPDVLAKGALAILCEEAGVEGEPRIVVPEVLSAMRQIARFNRENAPFPLSALPAALAKLRPRR